MGFKILVRSAPSLFLETLIASFEDQPYVLLAPNSSELNWTDAKAVDSYLKKKSPSIVVNYPLVPLQGNSAEVKCITRLTSQCEKLQCALIHISSYRVFGELPLETEIPESFEPAPSDEETYAKHLLAMEAASRACEKHILLRIGWMLNGEVDNVIEHLVPRLLQNEGDTLHVSDHAFGNPIQMRFAVHVVFSMIQQILCGASNWGAFHVHSADTCSEAEFNDNLIRLLRAEIDSEIQVPEVASANDDRKLMPGNANLQGRRCTDNFGIQLPSWRKGLKALIKRYLEKSRLLEQQA